MDPVTKASAPQIPLTIPICSVSKPSPPASLESPRKRGSTFMAKPSADRYKTIKRI